MQKKSRVRAAHTGRPQGPREAPRCIGGLSPHGRRAHPRGGSTREMRVAFWPRNLNHETNPPSEISRHLTDFRGTLELARDFGLERREIAAVYAGELTIEEAR